MGNKVRNVIGKNGKLSCWQVILNKFCEKLEKLNPGFRVSTIPESWIFRVKSASSSVLGQSLGQFYSLVCYIILDNQHKIFKKSEGRWRKYWAKIVILARWSTSHFSQSLWRSISKVNLALKDYFYETWVYFFKFVQEHWETEAKFNVQKSPEKTFWTNSS